MVTAGAGRGWESDVPLEDLGLPPELVTGEAVVLELRSASFATRALALALDLLILLVLTITMVVGTALLFGSLDEAAGAALGLVVTVGLLVGVPATVETLTRGRSVGKIAAGLRVVRDDGGPIRFRHALIRALLAVPEIYLSSGSIALITSLSNRRGKRLGDLLAGTYVIRERSGARTMPPVDMPPELAGWAVGMDLGRVPDALALASRAFLGRAGGLNPGSRAQLGTRLATQLALYVAPPPPAGTYPERFIAAVLAERRRRDLVRLQAEAASRAARDSRRRAASPLSAIGTALVSDD